MLTHIIDVKDIKNETDLRKTLEPAIAALKHGGIVIYPTDTVYGIGCDPLNEEALAKLLSIKGREGKPLPLLASSIEVVKRVAEITQEAQKLIKTFWPGALTLVLPLKTSLPSPITLGLQKVGLRIPGHAVARILAEGINGLIVGTSANRSGEPAPGDFEKAYSWAKDKVEIAIDGGICPLGQPSTVVEVNGEVKVIREGAIRVEEILRVLRL
ncbi:MAG: L-threonylcarbamoyladenylate synthase [Candidatus Nezhaarchaeota archaeon]|nr:L-threonylcarbamoyladenylate synthase [Candidatus Nezhaarchaeota archaeon]MCX8142270.1 L-threonylcarbamoyladenylate synthase [Candidatus Nezhaarchaeota archaeon]MDW8050757.1 L-threonylcarbamoyladenylate synthase [Nitrososphaerota archaeon]